MCGYVCSMVIFFCFENFVVLLECWLVCCDYSCMFVFLFVVILLLCVGGVDLYEVNMCCIGFVFVF